MENTDRVQKVSNTPGTHQSHCAHMTVSERTLAHYSDHNKEKRRKRANVWYKSSEETANGSDKHTCRTRYQQTPVEVYARFIAVDQVIAS